jgi:hypothetical protein
MLANIMTWEYLQDPNKLFNYSVKMSSGKSRLLKPFRLLDDILMSDLTSTMINMTYQDLRTNPILFGKLANTYSPDKSSCN